LFLQAYNRAVGIARKLANQPQSARYIAHKHKLYKRVSMGLTVSRKTAKNLAVRRKNERILTVSRKKMLTVKNSNHKIRSRDLLLSLMCYVCYAFYVFWQELARSDTPAQLLTMETFVPCNI